jgi:voltage-gated potassium channel
MVHSEEISLQKESITIGNIILLFSIFSLIFLVPLFPRELHKVFYNVLYTIIFFMTVFALGKYRKELLISAMTLTLVEWISSGLDLIYLTGFSRVAHMLFFIFVVIRLILQAASAKRVNLNVILESINGYLMLGVVFSIMVGIITLFSPGAYNFPVGMDVSNQQFSYFSEFLYYGFVTFTTLGYGDIVPLKPYARSLAMLTSVSGQIYVAVIIAMLVGKYASSDQTT